MATHFLVWLFLALFLFRNVRSLTLSSRLIHRFSDEAKAIMVSRNGELLAGSWPVRRTMEYYHVLVNSDLKRQKLKLNPKYQSLFPVEGSATVSLGNDFGWLHYTWVDIGTPNVSFLVALDAGSDLFWVPCDCIQCAPLSASYYNSLDRDLGVYNPSESSTSMRLSCSHELCSLGSNCKSPKQPCPYIVNYYSDNTSSSGLLVEDMLYLASNDDHASRSMVKTHVVIGCGRKQSGGYLDGIAPDGLLGLGFGDISVPSFLAKDGLMRNSFSICFDDNDDGRIFFGDQGSATQQSTPFLEREGKFPTYIVGVDGICTGGRCLKETGFQAQVDSGSSFTFLPDRVYDMVSKEFDRQMNASRLGNEDPWEYCYKASSLDMPKVPTVILRFSGNSSFEVHNPIFPYFGEEGELAGFCLALQSTTDDRGTIGQNLMTGYRIVFDRERLKLGWSSSNCRDLDNGTGVPSTPHPGDNTPNPLPSDEQQRNPGGRAVTPAVAGRTPNNPSSATTLVLSWWWWLQLSRLLLLLSTVSNYI